MHLYRMDQLHVFTVWKLNEVYVVWRGMSMEKGGQYVVLRYVYACVCVCMLMRCVHVHLYICHMFMFMHAFVEIICVCACSDSAAVFRQEEEAELKEYLMGQIR